MSKPKSVMNNNELIMKYLDNTSLEEIATDKLSKVYNNLSREIESRDDSQVICESIKKINTLIKAKEFLKLRVQLDPTNVTKIYGKITSIEGYSEHTVLKMTLITEYMLKFDETFYGEEGVYSLALGMGEDNKYDNIGLINKKLNNLSDSVENIEFISNAYEGKYIALLLTILSKTCRPYFFEFETILYGDYNKLLPNITNDYEFYEYEVISINNNKGFKGRVIFSASPFRRSHNRLLLAGSKPVIKIKKQNKRLFSTPSSIIDITDKWKLDNVLKLAIPNNINSLTYRVNHIGQGLNTYLVFNNCF